MTDASDGRMLLAAGELAAALAWFADHGWPADPALLADAGRAAFGLGRPADAQDLFDRAAALRPDADLHFLAGVSADHAGDPDGASARYQTALAMDPAHALAAFNLGVRYQAAGRADDALALYDHALRAQPDLADATINKANLLADRNPAAALDAYRAALAGNPAHPLVRYNTVTLLISLRRWDEAGATLAEAPAPDPRLASLHHLYRICRCLQHLSPVPASADDEQRRLAAFTRDLLALDRHYRDADAAACRDAAHALAHADIFPLPYYRIDCKPYQVVFGNLVCRLAQAAHPGHRTAPAAAPRQAGERVRVGIVSAYFRQHANWALPIRGWVEQLPADRIALYGYYAGHHRDAATAAAEARCVRFVSGPSSVEDLAAAIRADRLHVLIFPEIGMDPTALQLAALRLAPVQLTSWGHPVTSGFPTIDGFLSSDAMELPDADRFYSERLVRLPNLSVYYDRPPIEPVDPPLPAFPPDRVVCLCTQLMAKHRPANDRVFAAIAARAPAALFLFSAWPRADAAAEHGATFQHRLDAAFRAEGLEAERHVRLLPHLPTAAFLGLQRRAHLFLDSIGWSGCNTTLDAIAAGLPVVTLRGHFMRERHSAAILEQMGLGDLVSDSVDAYVRRAVALINSAELRARETALLRAADGRLRHDRAPIDALARLLEACADRGRLP